VNRTAASAGYQLAATSQTRRRHRPGESRNAQIHIDPIKCNSSRVASRSPVADLGQAGVRSMSCREPFGGTRVLCLSRPLLMTGSILLPALGSSGVAGRPLSPSARSRGKYAPIESNVRVSGLAAPRGCLKPSPNGANPLHFRLISKRALISNRPVLRAFSAVGPVTGENRTAREAQNLAVSDQCDEGHRLIVWLFLCAHCCRQVRRQRRSCARRSVEMPELVGASVRRLPRYRKRMRNRFSNRF
jgi:hypothetical protein